MPNFNDAEHQPDPDAFDYDLNHASRQDESSGARKRGERYVKNDPIKAAVRGRKDDVVRSLGIGWHGRDHINCPYPDHLDRDPSWRLMEDGHAVCTCRSVHSIFDVVIAMEGGDFEAAKIRVAELLGLDDLIIDPEAAVKPLTVEEVAEAKKLPADLLRKSGWFNLKGGGGKFHDQPPAVGINYKDKIGQRIWLRIRTGSTDPKKKFRWKAGDKGAPLYGAWQPYEGVPFCFLVEGETDTLTLWHNGFPAAGIPGAGNWSDDRHAPTLDGIPIIFVPIEPDKGGETVMRWLPHSTIAPRARAIYMPAETKDVSALYLHDPAGFKAALQALMDGAHPVPLPDAPEADKPGEKPVATQVMLDDFYGYLPEHKALFEPKRELWPCSAVDAKFPPVSKEISASQSLFKWRALHGMTWLPGEPTIIRGKLMVEGGWIYREGYRCFNKYIPPRIVPGNPQGAERWVAHVKLLYPNDWQHIVKWAAHRVQKPGEKINHILVLGGDPGIGKDSIILEPLKYAIGDSNFGDIAAAAVFGTFNGYVPTVVLRISEAHDFGDGNRFQFYEQMKLLGAAPPYVLRVNEKNIREYYVANVVAVVITTNYKSDGMYIPRLDRRHYVAWSDVPMPGKEPTPGSPLCEAYFNEFHKWLADGGNQDVAAYLRQPHLIADFNPKASPPQTPAFLEISEANAPQEESELMDAIDRAGNPKAISLNRIIKNASDGLAAWLKERKNSRLISGRLERCGYVRVPNPDSKSDGRWRVNDERQTVFGLKSESDAERLEAAKRLAEWGEASK